MKKLIIANWKCNPTSLLEVQDIFTKIKQGLKSDKKDQVIICPPFVYLVLLKGLTLGAQDVYFEEKGPFTGAISPLMLKDLGVEYVIIGHSERRIYFKETNQIINKKIKKCLESGLKVIFCIGESLKDRKAGKKTNVLKSQIKIGLDGVKNFENIFIAYEPVWAIGTGKNCSVKETISACRFIRNFLSKPIRVLYGGSVNSFNATLYLKENEINGLLVGGASLKPEEFLRIVYSIEN